jgi:hypothetical protein
MKCLCEGPYPSIEKQAQRLRSEPDMPPWPLETYVAWVEAINGALLAICIRQMQRRFGFGGMAP